jgi:hypothetical protein
LRADMTNLLPLLQSGADAASPLTGIELVRRKVRHMVMMGGRRLYPEDANGQEWNFGGCGYSNFWCGDYDDLGGVTLRTLRLWPEQVVCR